MVKVVAALICENGKFMICQRPEGKARALLWEFVGGKTEPGETEEQALVRECREELGVKIGVGEVYCRLLHEYPDLTIELVLFRCKIEEGPVQKLEHRDIRWILPEEIDGFEFCPADRQILEKIKREGL